VSSKIGVEPMMIFRFGKDIVRRSPNLIGFPSAPVSQASASSTIKILAVCRRRLRGALAATIFKEPPGNRFDKRVLRSSPSTRSAANEPRRHGVAEKIGSMSETT
jgi:hypothetical protein